MISDSQTLIRVRVSRRFPRATAACACCGRTRRADWKRKQAVAAALHVKSQASFAPSALLASSFRCDRGRFREQVRKERPSTGGSRLQPAGGEFRKQGFASAELVVRWETIVGRRYCRPCGAAENPVAASFRKAKSRNPARWCCGSTARPRSKSSICRGSILERVNRYFGFAAVGRIAIRQAPLRGQPRKPGRTLDPRSRSTALRTRCRGTDEDLKKALARLGAAVKRK